MNEAELLFTDVLGCDRTSLYLNKDKIIDKKSALSVAAALKRRFQGEPIQYILGKAEFMGLDFEVNPDVLIPRPETEILVETAIRLSCVINKNKKDPLRILDLCTGSGCIAVSLAASIAAAEVTASDISQAAINTACVNARNHKVKINFILSDLFSRIAPSDYDMIVSNPPYISSAEFACLQPEIYFEPRIALHAGDDGMSFYRRIIKDATAYLKKNGFLIIEMGYNHSDRTSALIEESGYFSVEEIIKDYSGIKRIMVAKKNG